MIARILKVLLALQLLAVIGLGYATHRMWRIDWLPALALAFGVALLVRMLITAQNFLLSRRYRSDLNFQDRLGWRELVCMFAAEFGATMLASSWTMAYPRCQRRLYDRPGLPVLLIHGYGCNRGYWKHMSALLARERISHDALDLEPVIAGIDDHVPLVHRAVEDLCKATGRDQVIILAHSMGGLVARAYLRAHGSARIARVITLGAPHHGTSLASFGIGSSAAQMHRSGRAPVPTTGAWLSALAATESEQARALFTSIYSRDDNIIAPQASCHLPGAKNIEFGAVGHVALGRNCRILQCVLDEIVLVSNEDTHKPESGGPGPGNAVLGPLHPRG